MFSIYQAKSATLLLPDTCTLQTHTGTIDKYNYSFSGSNYHLYKEASVVTQGKSVPIVFITNGNGYSAYGNNHSYDKLAKHLAGNGFLVITAQRPSNSTDKEQFTDRVIKKVIANFQLKSYSPVGLIGHSVGGDVVINAAKYNHTQSSKLNIQALMTIAPNTYITHYNRLNASHTPAYFTIYGSQDHDMSGSTSTLRESFATFNWAGTEYTTYNQAGATASTNRMDKHMIFVHGADHGGLIGSIHYDSATNVNDDYISTPNQFCITKGYANAFMRWKLNNQTLYQSYMLGNIVPKSIADMVSYRSDFKGNPAGTKLRMKFQSSVMYRHSIENFEDNDYDVYYKTANVHLTKIDQKQHSAYPHYIRDFTNSLLIRWKSYSQYQYAAFALNYFDKFSSNYNYLSIRIGQLWNENLYHENTSNNQYSNGINQSKTLYVGLKDKNNHFVWKEVTIQPNDKRKNASYNVGKTELETIRLPLSGFNNLDRNNLVAVYLAFKPNTEGSIVIDNIEWTTK